MIDSSGCDWPICCSPILLYPLALAGVNLESDGTGKTVWFGPLLGSDGLLLIDRDLAVSSQTHDRFSNRPQKAARGR